MINPYYKGIDVFTEDLNAFLKRKFMYKKDHAYISMNGNVCTNHMKNVELYIRFKRNHFIDIQNIITFARVEFFPQRKGYFSELIYETCKNASKYGIEYIGLEQCCTEMSVNFARKFGFTEIEKYSEENWKNYYLSCNDYIRNYEAVRKIKER